MYCKYCDICIQNVNIFNINSKFSTLLYILENWGYLQIVVLKDLAWIFHDILCKAFKNKAFDTCLNEI